MSGRAVKSRLLVSRLGTQCEASLCVPNGSVSKSSPGIRGGQQTLGPQMVQVVADLQPMKASSVGRVNHAIGLFRRPLPRLHEVPREIIELDGEPSMGGAARRRAACSFVGL